MKTPKKSTGPKMIRDNKSIYHPSWKSVAGKGDQPRQVTKKYEKNYTDIFPNSFKPIKFAMAIKLGILDFYYYTNYQSAIILLAVVPDPEA